MRLWNAFVLLLLTPFAQTKHRGRTCVCPCSPPEILTPDPPSTGSIGDDLPPIPSRADPPPGATVGYDLGDYRWIDTSVIPRGAGPEIPNIRQVQRGVFAHTLRWRDGWHDGDRSLAHGAYLQKGRAELCCLGGDTPMRIGQTWLIGTTILVPRDFAGARSFIDVGQLVHHQSYLDLDKKGGSFKITLRVFRNGLGSPSIRVRATTVPPDTWVSLVTRVRFSREGAYALSVDGDEFVEVDNIDTTYSRSGDGTFGGTFGLYMKNGRGDCTIYTANNFIMKIA